MAILDSNEIFFRQFEPKVKHRFIMYIYGIPAFMVKSADSPSFEDEEIKLDHINTYRKVRGKREWNSIDITLYDPITPSGAQAVMEWARLAYESVTGRAGYSDFYKKDIKLNPLGPVGDIVSEWDIRGAFLTSAEFGDFDWANTNDFVELACTLTYDYAVLQY